MKLQAPILSLRSIAKQLRRRRGTVILIGGTFDVFHVGHIRFLEKAKKLGGTVVVGVTTDALVRERKGGDRPYMTERERSALISKLRCVDYVFIARKVDWLSAGYLDVLRPDIFVIGREPDTVMRNKVFRKQLRQHNPSIRFIEIKRFIGRSTTDLAGVIRGDRQATHTSGFEIGMGRKIRH